ncbi:MAG: HEAT repeat domain-containing protein [Planctomycetaceae bacterium]
MHNIADANELASTTGGTMMAMGQTTIGRRSVQFALMAALMVSVGCASRGGRFPLARVFNKSNGSQQSARANRGARPTDEVLPKYNKNQLLAAARQYEKEGRTDQAVVYYRQVLALDPQNAEARQGLQIVQSGERRQETNIDELIAASRPAGSEQPRPSLNPTDEREQVDAEMSQLIAEAFAKKELAESSEKASPIVAVSATASTTEAAPTQLAVYDWGTTRPAQPEAAEPAKPASPSVELASAAAETSSPVIAEAEVSLEVVEAANQENPADWADGSKWQPRTVTTLCTDANAAVLREVEKLDSHDPEVRKAGLRALAEMGRDAASAEGAVRILLQDDHEIVQAYAAWAAWELTGNANPSVQSLAKLVQSDDSDVVQFAAFTLNGIGEQARPALPMLRQQLQNEKSFVRLHVAEALARIGTESDKVAATKALISLTTEGTSEVRTLSLMALGDSSKVPTPEVATAITSALHDSDAEVRSTAALTLGSFGPAAKSAITQLKFVAETDQPSVREAAQTAIACISK